MEMEMEMANITASIIFNEEQLRAYYNTSGSSLCKLQFVAYETGLRDGLYGQHNFIDEALVKQMMGEYAPMPTAVAYNYIHRDSDGSENLQALKVYILDTRDAPALNDLRAFKADVAFPLEAEGLWVLIKNIDVVKLVPVDNLEQIDNILHVADAAYADRIVTMSYRSNPNKLRIV